MWPKNCPVIVLSYLEKRKTNVCCRLHCFDISSHSYCLLLRLAWATTAQTSFEKLHFPAKITQKSQRPISHSNTRLRGGGGMPGLLALLCQSDVLSWELVETSFNRFHERSGVQLPVDNVIVVPAPAAETQARWDVTNDVYLWREGLLWKHVGTKTKEL